MKLLKRLIVFAAFTNGISAIELQAIDFKNLMNCAHQKIDYSLQAFNAYRSKILENQHVQYITQIYENKTPFFIKNNIKNITYGVLISGSLYFLYKKYITPILLQNTNNKVTKPITEDMKKIINTISVEKTNKSLALDISNALDTSKINFKNAQSDLNKQLPNEIENTNLFWKKVQYERTPKNFKHASELDRKHIYMISANKEKEGVQEAKTEIQNEIIQNNTDDNNRITKKNANLRQSFQNDTTLIQRTELNEEQLSKNFVVKYLYECENEELKKLGILFFEFKETLEKNQANFSNADTLLKYLKAHISLIKDEEITTELTFIIELLEDIVSDGTHLNILSPNVLDIENCINNYTSKKENNKNQDYAAYVDIYELAYSIKEQEFILYFTNKTDPTKVQQLNNLYTDLNTKILWYSPINKSVLNNKIFVKQYLDHIKTPYVVEVNNMYNEDYVRKNFYHNVKPMLDYETIELLDPNQPDYYEKMINDRKLYKKLRTLKQDCEVLKKDISDLKEKVDKF